MNQSYKLDKGERAVEDLKNAITNRIDGNKVLFPDNTSVFSALQEIIEHCESLLIKRGFRYTDRR